jgi:hypothetical protein
MAPGHWSPETTGWIQRPRLWTALEPCGACKAGVLLLGKTPAPNFDRSGCRTKIRRGSRSKVRTKKPIPGRSEIGAHITSFNFVSTPERRYPSRGGMEPRLRRHLRPRAHGSSWPARQKITAEEFRSPSSGCHPAPVGHHFLVAHGFEDRGLGQSRQQVGRDRARPGPDLLEERLVLLARVRN